MDDNKKRKLKIVMFGQKRIPSREGGVEIVVEELAKRMVQKGYEVTCINRDGHHVSGAEFDTQKCSEYKGIKIETVPTIQRKGFAAASSAMFATIKAAFGKYDVVHIHAEGPAAYCSLIRLFDGISGGNHKRKKIIATCHGLDWDRPRWRDSFGGRFIKRGERKMVRHADHIIVLSRGVQEYFKKTYNRETVYIPNGVVKPEIKAAKVITEKWGLKKDEYILALARLTEEKNIHLLIEAYNEMSKTSKKLVIAGGSSDSAEYIEKLNKLAGKNENIIFTGFVQGEEIEELYSNAYIYCLPSSLEGMPLSLLEAMSYGNCCLVSDIPECVDVVEDKAVVFELDSKSDDLCKKLTELCSDESLAQKYKEQASEYICRKYDWDEVVEQTLGLYTSK